MALRRDHSNASKSCAQPPRQRSTKKDYDYEKVVSDIVALAERRPLGDKLGEICAFILWVDL